MRACLDGPVLRFRALVDGGAAGQAVPSDERALAQILSCGCARPTPHIRCELTLPDTRGVTNQGTSGLLT
jgi:hypothetical protein